MLQDQKQWVNHEEKHYKDLKILVNTAKNQKTKSNFLIFSMLEFAVFKFRIFTQNVKQLKDTM